MKVTLKNGKDNVVDLDIVIPAKEAADAYNKAAAKISQYVNIDGFRKGKAPRAIVEKHVGTERIKIEAIESLMPRTISKAIEENKLDVITPGMLLLNRLFRQGREKVYSGSGF